MAGDGRAARSNGGYYLDSAGRLRQVDVSGARFLKALASRTRTYGSWFYGNQGRTDYRSLTRDSASDSAMPDAAKPYGTLAHTAANSPAVGRAEAGWQEPTQVASSRI